MLYLNLTECTDSYSGYKDRWFKRDISHCHNGTDINMMANLFNTIHGVLQTHFRNWNNRQLNIH